MSPVRPRVAASRYRARVVDSDEYFRQVVAYVHLNPVSAGIVDDLASSLRTEQHIHGRIEFSLLAVSRYGFRACDIAALLCKGRNSVTRWLNRGLRNEREDPDFSERVSRIDEEISRR